MEKLTNPRLRGSNVMLNSFGSCITNTSEEFSRTPEMSMCKIFSEPGVFLHQTESAIPLEQLKSLANTHSCGELNKQVDMVNSNVQLIDFTLLLESNLPDEKLTIHPNPVEFHGIHSIFTFPHKVKSVLSEAMLPRFQIHFLSPQTFIRNKVHTMFDVYFEEPSISASFTKNSQELNLMGDGDSSPNLKIWVSSPWM